MRKIVVIARREYKAAVQTRAFLISLVVLPILIGGSVLVQWFLKGQVDTSEKKFAVVDRTPHEQLAVILTGAADVWNKSRIDQSGKATQPAFVVEKVTPGGETREALLQQRFELSERVRKGTLFGFVEIGSRVLDVPTTFPAPAVVPTHRMRNSDDLFAASSSTAEDPLAIRYQSNSPAYETFRNFAGPVINLAIREARYAAQGLPADKVRAASQSVPLMNKGLTRRNAQTGQLEEGRDENPIISLLVPGGLLMLMFLLILLGATPLMQGVVEEKMQRIAEVLLGSVRPFELMAGKLLGLVGVSVTLAAVYLSGAYWAANHYGYADLIPVEAMAWFLVFLVLGVLMYGSLFITVGAACTDLRETQAMLWPVMLMAMVPMFVWLNVVQEPTSTFATVASFLPNATPMLMLARVAVPPGIPWWQPAVGVIDVLAATLACVYAAGRVFRVGLLMQGKAATPRDIARWIFQG